MTPNTHAEPQTLPAHPPTEPAGASPVTTGCTLTLVLDDSAYLHDDGSASTAWYEQLTLMPGRYPLEISGERASCYITATLTSRHPAKTAETCTIPIAYRRDFCLFEITDGVVWVTPDVAARVEGTR